MKNMEIISRVFSKMASGVLLLLLVVLAVPARGQHLDWVKQAGGLDSEGFSIAVDGEGNSYVTGFFDDTATFGAGEGNETELTSLGQFDIFVAKYADDGSLVWARQTGGSVTDEGQGIAVDGGGNIYVTGRFGDTATFGVGEDNETELTSFGNNDIFVAKYADDGSLVWARQAGGSVADEGQGIAIDGGGNIYVTGRFGDTATFGVGEDNETELTSFGGSNIFVAKYADDGSLVWTRQASGSIGNGIAVDGEGNSYVTGPFLDTAIFGVGEDNETELNSFGLADIFVAKYAGDGSLVWVRQAGGSGSAVGNGIAIDGDGNSYVTGRFGDTATFGSGETNETELTSFGQNDIFVARFAGDGSLVWARQVGGSVSDEGQGIAVDGEGNSYVTGFFLDTATFGVGEGNETELTSFGNSDIFVAKYAGDGSLVWARQAGGSFSDIGRGIAVDGEGKSYVTGRFVDTATFGVGEGNETELTSFGFADIFVANYAGTTIDSLIDMTEVLGLNQGIKNSLLAKLRNVRKATESPNAEQRQNAANVLGAFINAVEAQSGKGLTEEQADQLIELAEKILPSFQ